MKRSIVPIAMAVLLLALGAITPVSAHFQMVLPSDDVIGRPPTLHVSWRAGRGNNL